MMEVPADTEIFYVFGDRLYGWPGCVSMTSYLPDDPRLFLAGRAAGVETLEKYDDTLTSVLLGVPTPVTAPMISGGESFGEDCDQRSYVYTYMNQYGEESAPSPPSNALTVKDGAAVSVSGLASPPSGYGQLTINLYRSATGTRLGEEKGRLPQTGYLLVAEGLAGGSYSDSSLIKLLNDCLRTEMDRPTPAGLRRISHVNGTGILCGVRDNQVLFSQNFEPNNWPVEGTITLPDNIVNMVTVDQTVYVSTSGKAYVIEGALSCDESSQIYQLRAVSDTDIPLPDIGRHPRSAVATPFGMIYASKDGLVLLKGGGGQIGFEILTAGWWDRDQWLALRPETIRLGYWRGHLFIVTDSQFDYILNLDHKTYGDVDLGALTTFTLDDKSDMIESKTVIKDMFTTNNGELLLLADNKIYQWNAGNNYLRYKWTSEGLLGGTTTYTSARVEVDEGDILFWLRDGKLKYRIGSTTSGQPFRLERLSREDEYRFTFEGTGTVSFLEVGTSFNQLHQGV
jgi:hypothetical protein